MSLSPEQQRAVESNSPVICMMAGPGSGKTHTLVERIKRLIADGAEPGHMVVITFTNEAANELKSRTDAVFAYCGTLHGYMLKLLQQYGTSIGLGESISVINEDLRDDLLGEVIYETGYKTTKKELKEALAAGPNALNDIKTNGGALSKAQTTALAFYQRCIRESVVDYDSILHFGLTLAKQIEAWDLKVLFLFVDEFQDSAPIDAAIYEALPIANKFFIGDPDQSIYAFRGADVENIISLSQQPDTKVLLLEDNYRSDVQITQAAQMLIEYNPNRPEKVTRSITTAAGSVTVNEYPIEDEELLALAQNINNLPDPNEVAVLVRTNRLVDYFKRGLQSYRVPVPNEYRAPLPADWKRTLLYLSLLCNPGNDKLAYRWLCLTNKTKADIIKMEALSQFMTINESWLKLPAQIGVESVMRSLIEANVSMESCERVQLAIDALEGDDGIPQLLSVLQFEPPIEKKPGVTVSTIHAAKGREWDHVFLPAFEQGIIPSLSKKASIEEERRVAFVGMTRARHTLTITHAKVRAEQYRSGEYMAAPSQFIKEMGVN